MVETVSAPTVTPSTGPIGISPPTEAFGATALGQGLAKVGQAEQGFSDVLAKHAQAFQQVNNAIASNTATSNSITELANLRSTYVQENPGMAASDPKNVGKYYTDVDAIVAKHGEGLSPLAGEEYLAQSRRYGALAKDSIVTWGSGQRLKAGNDSATAAIQTATATAVANYDDPNARALAIQTIGTQVNALQKLNGWEPDKVTQELKANVGNIYAGGIIQALSSGDVAKAQQIFEEHKNDFGTFEQADTLARGLKTAVHANDVQTSAFTIVHGGNPANVSTSPDEVFTRGVIQQESSGGKNLVGQPTQYGTPVGAGQTLPKTAQAMAEKLGVPWQPALMTSHTPEAIAYQTQLSKAYWDQGVEAEGGNIPRALMYYYGGPDERQWLAKTHTYAQAVLSRLGQGGTSQTSWGAIPLDPRASAATNEGTGDQVIMARALQLYPTDAASRMQAVESARTQLHLQIQVLDGQQKDGFDHMLQMITQNNIGDPTQLQKLNPTLWNSLRPEYQTALEDKARFQGNLFTEARYDNEKALNVAFANSKTNPKPFLAMDLRSMDLTNSDLQKFTKAQAQVAAGAGAYSESDKAFDRAMRSPQMNSQIASLGIGSDVEATARLQGLLKGEFDTWTDIHGKAPTDKERNEQIYPSVWRAFAGGPNAMGVKGSYEYSAAMKTLSAGNNTNPSTAEIYEEMARNRTATVLQLRKEGVPHPSVQQVEARMQKQLGG